MGMKSRTFEPDADDPTAAINGPAARGGKNLRVQLTAKERKRVEELIREAKSLSEIARLEKELNEGRVPAGALGGGGEDMEE